MRPGETIQIRWFEIPANTYSVDFIYKQSNGATLVIGTASPDQDGVSISWTIPANLAGDLYASPRI